MNCRYSTQIIIGHYFTLHTCFYFSCDVMRVIFLRPSCAYKALLVILAVVVLCVTLQFWNSGCSSKQSQFIIESMVGGH